ncbi:hypothetical protein D3C72_1136510 [compost metagenome]
MKPLTVYAEIVAVPSGARAILFDNLGAIAGRMTAETVGLGTAWAKRAASELMVSGGARAAETFALSLQVSTFVDGAFDVSTVAIA